MTKLRGKVISHLGDSLSVEHENEIFRCFLRPNLEEIVVGDNVIFSISDKIHNTGLIDKLEPRSSVIWRPKNPKKINKFNPQLKPMVANIDQINIVIAAKPKPQEYLIDQFIINAANNNLNYILIINKTDLTKAKEYEEIKKIRKTYRDLGVTVIGTSCKTGRGFSRLKTHIRNKTSIFLGQSGVGKSSIMSTLMGDDSIVRGALTKKGEQGAHTTSRAELYHLPFGGDLIDSPGVRDIGISHFTAVQIAKGFPELAALLGTCKFRDCSHTHEPECAFIVAKKDGKISPERFERFLNLIK